MHMAQRVKKELGPDCTGSAHEPQQRSAEEYHGVLSLSSLGQGLLDELGMVSATGKNVSADLILLLFALDLVMAQCLLEVIL